MNLYLVHGVGVNRMGSVFELRRAADANFRFIYDSTSRLKLLVNCVLNSVHGRFRSKVVHPCLQSHVESDHKIFLALMDHHTAVMASCAYLQAFLPCVEVHGS